MTLWVSLDTLLCDMAAADLFLDYRSYTTDELIAERTALRASRTIYLSQNMGNKGMTRNLNLLEDRLRAVAFVLRERGPLFPVKPPINIGQGITDFSQVER